MVFAKLLCVALEEVLRRWRNMYARWSSGDGNTSPKIVRAHSSTRTLHFENTIKIPNVRQRLTISGRLFASTGRLTKKMREILPWCRASIGSSQSAEMLGLQRCVRRMMRPIQIQATAATLTEISISKGIKFVCQDTRLGYIWAVKCIGTQRLCFVATSL